MDSVLRSDFLKSATFGVKRGSDGHFLDQTVLVL